MKNCITLAVLFIAFLMPAKTFAWGQKGHQLVAQVAFKYLDKATQAKVLKYLDGMTIEQAATWMDDVRSDPNYAYLKPWHYANFEKGEKVVMVHGNNIVYRLDITVGELKNIKKLSDAAIKMRLLYLFHLAGDIHQPLHLGYGSDLGGNSYNVVFRGKKTNLHSLWDSGIITAKKITLQDCLDAKSYTPEEILAIQNSSVLDWATESQGFVAGAYENTQPRINDAYATANAAIICQQIQRGGIRLAGVLAASFK